MNSLALHETQTSGKVNKVRMHMDANFPLAHVESPFIHGLSLGFRTNQRLLKIPSAEYYYYIIITTHGKVIMALNYIFQFTC